MFLVNSPVLEKLKPHIQQCVAEIKSAVDHRQPILIRHHGDADGYAAGIALERALLPIISAKHRRERDLFYYYTRLPLLVPFYGYQEATKDLQIASRNAEQFHMKAPLILILDTGSAEESLAGLQKATLYGASCIVVDHHPLAKVIGKHLLVQVNPHLVHSTYDFCSGMLCAEVAHALLGHPTHDHNSHLAFIAAVSAVADKVASTEAEQYRELAEKEGFSKELIGRCAAALDFEAHALGPTNGRETVHDLLGRDPKKQEALLALIETQLGPAREQHLTAALHYATIKEHKQFIEVHIPIDDIREKGSYPDRGKMCGLVLDHFKKKQKKNTLIVGVGDTALVFRCSTDILSFDVNAFIAHCQKAVPYAQCHGGGHRVAGTMHFIPAARDEVLAALKGYVQGL